MRFFISTIFILFGITANSQVHLKRQKFYEISVGGFDAILPSKSNISFQCSVGQYNRKVNGNAFGFAYNQKRTTIFDAQTNNMLVTQIPIQQLYVLYKTDVGIYDNEMNNFHIKVIGRVNIGYESLNKEQATVENIYQFSAKSGFLFGVGAGLEIEYIPIVLGVHQNINVLSNYQKFSSITFLGFRFHIN
jgi:hypothetical protein